MPGESRAALERLQPLSDLRLGPFAPATADAIQQAVIIVEAEQQVLYVPAAVLVDRADHGIDGFPQLELLHRAFAGLVSFASILRHDAIDPLPGRLQPVATAGKLAGFIALNCFGG